MGVGDGERSKGGTCPLMNEGGAPNANVPPPHYLKVGKKKFCV
jgi:hypothetical protein